MLDQADLILVAGSRLRINETRDNQARLPRNLVQIDLDPGANGRTWFKNPAFQVRPIGQNASR